MNETDRKTFLMWSKTEEYSEHIAEAKQNITKALEKFDRLFVSFSGGKDSTVMLHLVLQQNPDVLVFHWDYGRYYIPREVATDIIENISKLGGKNIRVESSKRYEKEGRDAVNILGQVLIGRVMPKMKHEGFDACFVGLRAEEGIKRREKTKSLWISHGKHVGPAEVFPVRNLTWLDVWACIVSNDLPYLSVYDVYGPALGWDKARFVTFFDMEFEKFGAPYLDGFFFPQYKNKQ